MTQQRITNYFKNTPNLVNIRQHTFPEDIEALIKSFLTNKKIQLKIPQFRESYRWAIPLHPHWYMRQQVDRVALTVQGYGHKLFRELDYPIIYELGTKLSQIIDSTTPSEKANRIAAGFV
jgi:hypothetical protein